MIAIGLAALKVLQVWKEDREATSKPVRRKALSGALEAGKSLGRPQLASTKSIVNRNLFDPQRGAGNQDSAQGSSQGEGELGDLYLLGTVIAGGQRYAIIEIPSKNDPRSRRAKRLRRAGRQARGKLRRLALGDTLKGFKLEEIHAQRVVFTKGFSTINLVLDFSRKVKVEKVKEQVKAPKKARRLPTAKNPRRVVGKSPRPAVAR